MPIRAKIIRALLNNFPCPTTTASQKCSTLLYSKGWSSCSVRCSSLLSCKKMDYCLRNTKSENNLVMWYIAGAARREETHEPPNVLINMKEPKFFPDSERSDECIDFTMIITSRHNASISNLGVVSDGKFEFIRNMSKLQKFTSNFVVGKSVDKIFLGLSKYFLYQKQPYRIIASNLIYSQSKTEISPMSLDGVTGFNLARDFFSSLESLVSNPESSKYALEHTD
ncbi:hypothetical protein AGLY_006264 [Aphis glycines]|uniref:Uncharacterized protein n=1 Tax=Aphis glycines TaxID=307491 RepID=A0A6G0TSW4_APHGL|nr:hypothetical protein AGLY_006264 [Aphis glycines]